MSDTDNQTQEQPKEVTMLGATLFVLKCHHKHHHEIHLIGTKFQLTQAVSLIFAPTNHTSLKNSPPTLSR